MPVFVASDGTVYFANGLHNSYLYSLSSGELNLIDYSSPKEFNKYNSSTALFIAGSTFLNSVKQVNGGSTSILYTDSNIDDFVKQNRCFTTPQSGRNAAVRNCDFGCCGGCFNTTGCRVANFVGGAHVGVI